MSISIRTSWIIKTSLAWARLWCRVYMKRYVMCETQDVTSNPPFGVKRYYSIAVRNLFLGLFYCQRWAWKLFLKSANRKSANSWAHSTITNFSGVPVRKSQIPKLSWFMIYLQNAKAQIYTKYCTTLSQYGTQTGFIKRSVFILNKCELELYMLYSIQ